MGVATAARRRSLPTIAPNGPSARRSPLIRAGPPVRRAAVITIPGVSFTRKPTGTSSLIRPYEPTTVMYPLRLRALPGRARRGNPRRVGTGKVNAGDERRLGADQPAELVRDRREHLARAGAAGHQRGHPPQRGLLVGKPARPVLVQLTTARPGVGGAPLAAPGIWRP